MKATKTTGNDYNFIKQLGIYAGVTVLFALLATGSRVITWSLGNANQMFMLVNIMLALGFVVYLNQSGYRIDPNPRINDKATLYGVYLCISLIVIASFCRPDIGWSNNIPANIRLFIETLLIAAADEVVFRAFGDHCFREKGLREEAAMVICYSAYYLYCFADGTREGLTAFILAIGVGILFTGLYLRYRKLSANIIHHFILIYLMRMTAINSSSGELILGRIAPFIFALGILAMIWYGLRLIQAFNAGGVSDDLKPEDSVDLLRAFSDSKDRYKEKVMTKAEPKVEKSVDRYRAKQEARAADYEAKQEAKAAKLEARKEKKDSENR